MVHVMIRIAAPILFLAFLCSTATSNQSSHPGDQQELFFGVALDGYPLTARQLQSIHAELKLRPSMVVFFLQWPENPDAGHFPWETLQVLDGFGALPCLTWEPMSINQDGEQVIPADAIVNGGVYEGYVRNFARAARDYGRPLLLRFAHEMNLSRYHWGMKDTDYGPEAPSVYQEMFRFVVRAFREEGAHNVLFVFCPNAESLPHPLWSVQGAWNTATAYYPGDDYVDILGLDGYNWGTTQTHAEHGWDSTFRSFEEILGPMYAELRKLSPEKPIMVFETAVANQGGDKTAWIKEAVQTMENWGMAGFVWFEANKEVDWRLTTGTDAKLTNFLRDRITGDAGTNLGIVDVPRN